MADALKGGGTPTRGAAFRRATGGASDVRVARARELQARELHWEAHEADELAARRRAERDALIRRLRAENPKKWSRGGWAAALGTRFRRSWSACGLEVLH